MSNLKLMKIIFGSPKIKNVVFRMITASYVSDEYAKPDYSFLPNENKYHSDDVGKYDTDIDKANKLLSEAGVSNLKLIISNNVPQQKQAAIIHLVACHLFK